MVSLLIWCHLVPPSRANQIRRVDTNEIWHGRKPPTLHREWPMQYTRQRQVLDQKQDFAPVLSFIANTT
jgi:hypothetical protein